MADEPDFTISILMSVYHRVDPDALSMCLDSLSSQTVMPRQIIVVKDGPLTESLDNLLDIFAARFPETVELIPLNENQGLIKALNTGLSHCNGQWILRMDADDVAVPERVEVQLDFIRKNPGIDVLGSSMLEFENNPDEPLRQKPVAETHEAIVKQLPYRNPMNHPTVLMKKSTIESIGGYPSLQYLEDYFLWAKLIVKGARFHNIEKALHLYRFDAGTLKRRAGTLNFLNECRLRWWMYQHGLMGVMTLISVVVLQIILRFSPLTLRRMIWQLSRRSLQ